MMHELWRVYSAEQVGGHNISRYYPSMWQVALGKPHEKNSASTWCAHKITGLIFFRFPVNLATASGVWYWLVLSPPFTFTISRSCGKKFGSSLYLKWVMFLFSVGIMLSVNVEQCINVKFCVKLGKSATEMYDLLKRVYGDKCLCCTQVFEWFQRFKEGREEIRDDWQPDRPSTSKTDANIKKVGETVR